MVLCGEVRGDDEQVPVVAGRTVAAPQLQRVQVEEILELQHEQLTQRRESERIRRKAMSENGIPVNFEADRILDDF